MAEKPKAVFGITEHKGKSFWTQIGVAFVNQDGSLNVQLNFLPLNGKCQIRDQKEKEG